MAYTAKILMKKVVCVGPQDTVAKACQVMKQKNIGSVFVGKPDKPQGIFTERDVARRVVAEGIDPVKTPVSSVMTKKLVTVEASEPLDKVFDCLAKGQFRHLPIMEASKIVGIVSLTDISYALREMYREEKFLQSFAENLPAAAEAAAPPDRAKDETPHPQAGV